MIAREDYRDLEALERSTAGLCVEPQLPQRPRARGVGRLVVADTNDLDGLEQAEVTDENHEPFAIFLLDEKPQMLQGGPQMLIAGPVAIIPLGVLEKGERASDRRGQ